MQQLDVPLLPAEAEVLADENADTCAVDVVDVAQVDHDLATPFLNELVNLRPEGNLSLVQHQLAAEFEDGYVSDASFSNRQQRRAPFKDRDLDYSRASSVTRRSLISAL